MKTKTITREYDDEGRLVKETTVESDTAGYTHVWLPCSCGSTYCPQHGYRYPRPYWQVSPGTATGKTTTSPTLTINCSTASTSDVVKTLNKHYATARL